MTGRSSFYKSLFFIALLGGAIHTVGQDAAAQADSPAQTSEPVLIQPAPDVLLPDMQLQPVPGTMSAQEFTGLMEGAHEAALTLERFEALKKAEPDLVILDLRSREAFDARHIKGAVNAPLGEITEKTLPAILPDKNRAVVLVCDESFFPTRRISMTLQAWPVLKDSGYQKLYRLNLWRPAQETGMMLTREDIEQRVEFEGAAPPPQGQRPPAP